MLFLIEFILFNSQFHMCSICLSPRTFCSLWLVKKAASWKLLFWPITHYLLCRDLRKCCTCRFIITI